MSSLTLNIPGDFLINVSQNHHSDDLFPLLNNSYSLVIVEKSFYNSGQGIIGFDPGKIFLDRKSTRLNSSH
jgi:hypothetical protein